MSGGGDKIRSDHSQLNTLFAKFQQDAPEMLSLDIKLMRNVLKRTESSKTQILEECVKRERERKSIEMQMLKTFSK